MGVPMNRLEQEAPTRHLVPDVLSPGLDLVFCGTAPSPISFKRRAYYANPGNSFWPTLHVSACCRALRARALPRCCATASGSPISTRPSTAATTS